MIQKKTMTAEKALSKLAALCAKAEYCTGDLEEKMRKWGIDGENRKKNIEYLVSHKYVDDARYCRAFVNDKITYNRWGRRKIELALWQKHIPEDVSAPVLDEIPDEKYIEVLKPLLQAKFSTIKAETDYERSMKLIRFAIGRGFSLDIIKKAIGGIEL